MFINPENYYAFDDAADIGMYVAFGGVPSKKAYNRLRNAVLEGDIIDVNIVKQKEIKISDNILHHRGRYNDPYTEGFNKGYREGIVDAIDGVYATRRASFIFGAALSVIGFGGKLLFGK